MTTREKTNLTKTADNIVSLLRNQGLKASKPEDLGRCIESYVEYGSSIVRLIFFEPRYSDSIIVKLTTSAIGDCDESLYTPTGLYVLARDEQEAIENIMRKLRLVTIQSNTA